MAVAERACNNPDNTVEYNTYILQEFNLLVALIMKNDNVGNSDDLNKRVEYFRLIDYMLALVFKSCFRCSTTKWIVIGHYY